MQGSFFHGLISGLNEGITATRKQNQQDAEKEIQAEQDILMHLAKTHPDQATRDKAVESLLTIHESGKPTGFLGKLLGKKSSNPDIAALIASAHPASGGGGQEAPQPTSPPSVAPPPPDLAAAPTEAPQPAPVFAPAAPVSDAPEDRGAPPTAPVTPLPVDPAGPAATPINTTKQESPISYSAGAQAPAPVSTTPAPFPPPPAASMPPAPPAPPVGLGGLSPEQSAIATASAPMKAFVQLMKETNPAITPQELQDAVLNRFGGSGQRAASTQQDRLVAELLTERENGTITPDRQQLLDYIQQKNKVMSSQRDRDIAAAREKRDKALADARIAAQDKTIAGQLRVAQMRIAAARANHQDTVANGLEKELRSTKLKLATLKPAEVATLDNIQFAKPAIEDVKKILEDSGLKDDNSIAAAANTRAQNFLYTHGFQEDIWSNLNQEIAFLNLPTARQYMQGRPNQKIYEDIMAHLPNPKVDTGKQMYDKLVNIEKFAGFIEEGIQTAVEGRVKVGLGAAGYTKPSSTPPSPIDADLAALEAALRLKPKNKK